MSKNPQQALKQDKTSEKMTSAISYLRNRLNEYASNRRSGVSALDPEHQEYEKALQIYKDTSGELVTISEGEGKPVSTESFEEFKEKILHDPVKTKQFINEVSSETRSRFEIHDDEQRSRQNILKQAGLEKFLISSLVPSIFACFDLTTNSCNLTSAKDQTPPSTAISDADFFVQHLKNFAANYKQNYVENIINFSLEMAIKKARTINPEFAIKNITLSPNLECAFLPETLTNLPGLEKFHSNGSSLMHLKTSALEVEIYDSKNLTHLYALNAKKIYCSSSPNLAKLAIPEAKNVFLVNCAIQNFVANKAQKLFFSNCDELANIFSLEAKEVICDLCPELKKVVAPDSEILKIGYADGSRFVLTNSPGRCAEFPELSQDTSKHQVIEVNTKTKFFTGRRISGEDADEARKLESWQIDEMEINLAQSYAKAITPKQKSCLSKGSAERLSGKKVTFSNNDETVEYSVER